jgi:hypothetical protein
MKRIAILAMLYLTALCAGPAFAEGCESGTQAPPDAQEKAFYSLFVTLRNAIPKPLAGWQYEDASKAKLAPAYDYLPASICDHSGYYIGLDMDYTRPMSPADSQKEMQAMQAKPDPVKQKKLDGLLAQQQALAQKSIAAAQKQDSDTMQSLGKQTDALNAQITQTQLDMNAAQAAALTALQRDRSAKLRIAINDAGGVSCYGNPKLLQVAGGVAYQCQNAATYSSPGNQLDPPRGRIVVVYGKARQRTDDWKWKDEKGQEHNDSAIVIETSVDPKSMAVQYVTIDIVGDDLVRAESLYKEMNLAPLAALVKK